MRSHILGFAAAIAMLSYIASCGYNSSAFARDMDGASDGYTPAQREWVRNLKSKSGVPCCDDADGYDVQWYIKANHYVVILPGPDGNPYHFDVPAHAVIDGPSPLPSARVWYAESAGYPGGKFIRCFVPGSLF